MFCSLDRETDELYSFGVKAFDLGIPSQTSTKFITVQLTDINDNPPVFPQNISGGRSVA